jgi:hypothetical protein
MAFTHALYYPWIDIENIDNLNWLKTALLYWDNISTIVPQDRIGVPVESITSKYLHDLGILHSVHVNPYYGPVLEASHDFLDYLSTEEARVVMNPSGASVHHMSPIEIGKNAARVNIMKMSEELRTTLLNSGRVTQEGEWLIFNQNAANYFMSLLASYVARDHHYAPITDDVTFDSLSSRVFRGDNPHVPRKQLGEGLIAQMAIDTIGIADDTSFDDIILFREQFKDELGLFRSEIGKLAQSIDPQTPSIDSLNQQILDIFSNQIKPAINNLRKNTKKTKINIVTTTIITSIALAFAIHIDNQLAKYSIDPICQVGFQRVGISIKNLDLISNNPYSFVLKASDNLA